MPFFNNNLWYDIKGYTNSCWLIIPCYNLSYHYVHNKNTYINYSKKEYSKHCNEESEGACTISVGRAFHTEHD